MNKIIFLVSFIMFFILVNFGISIKARIDSLKDEIPRLESNNMDVSRKINEKKMLTKQAPVFLSKAYERVINQVRMLESYSGTNMNVQLDDLTDIDDVSNRYMDTEYKGVRGLRIKIVVDKFSEETDMGIVLDDIHLLERNTDFIASEISKDNTSLVVRGEIYGL